MKDLFKLIKSLKPSEKRYFTLSAGIHTPSKKNNYLRLFKALDAMPEENEIEFEKQNRKEAFMNNLAVHKSHLYDLLLQTLRNFNEENIEEWTIKKNLYKIEILASKGLDAECESLIKKTKEKAWKYEQYNFLLEIIELEMYLFGNCRIGNFQKEYYALIQAEKDKALKIIQDYNYILSTWHRLNLIFINEIHQPFKIIKEEAKLVIEHPLMSIEPPEHLSLRSRNRYFACYELYFNAIGDAEQCYNYNKKLIENRKLIDEKMPNFTPDAMAVYFNFMIACFKCKKWDEMEEYLFKTHAFPVSFLQQEIRQTHNYCYAGILLYLATKQYEKAKEVVDVFLQAKQRYSGSYRLDFMLFTLCHCGWYYFVTGDHEQAYSLWREISQGPKYSIEIRSQAITKCFQLIYFYSQKKEDLLAAELANTKRFLKQNFLLNENEALFLSTMSKVEFNKKDSSLFADLHAEVLKSEQILNEKSVVNIFILEWIEQQSR